MSEAPNDEYLARARRVGPDRQRHERPQRRRELQDYKRVAPLRRPQGQEGK